MLADINTELHQGLGRVEGKLDILIASQSSLADRVVKLGEGHAQHGERITALESRNTSLRSLVGIIIAIAAAAAAIFGNLRGFFHL